MMRVELQTKGKKLMVETAAFTELKQFVQTAVDQFNRVVEDDEPVVTKAYGFQPDEPEDEEDEKN